MISFAYNQGSKSGFFDFISLAFADIHTAIDNWQSFSFAIMESFPALGLILILSILLVAIVGMNLLSKDTSIAISSFHLHLKI